MAAKHIESPPLSEDALAEMARYGITRVQIDNFYFGEFRYTNLDDAIAQAKRRRDPDVSG